MVNPEGPPTDLANSTVSEAPVANADVPTAVPVVDADAPAAADAPNGASLEISVSTTDVDTHKTAMAPKSILKESRIAAAESKAQSQINKWIKGDHNVQKKPINAEPLATERATSNTVQPADPPAVSKPEPVEQKSTTNPELIQDDELLPLPPPITLALRDDTIDGFRKRRTAAKSVLTSEKQQPTKRPRTTTAKSPPPAKKNGQTKAQKSAPQKASKSSSRSSSGVPEVWSGKPDDNLGEGFEWSKGWTKKMYERQTGKTKGRLDSYWFTPVLQKKLRSMLEVKGFMTALKAHGGDEEAAWSSLKK